MNTRMKRVLSSKEAAAYMALLNATIEHDLHVFPKIRLCDLVEIKDGELSAQELEYAGRAYFDFVLSSKDYTTCLVIDTVFSSDYSPKWIENAELKDKICNVLDIPQVRIDCSQLAFYQVEEFMHLIVETLHDDWKGKNIVPSIKYHGCLLHSENCSTESCSEFAAITAWLFALHHDDNREIKPRSARLSCQTYDSDDGYFISSIDLQAGKMELQIATSKCRVSDQAESLGQRLSLSLAASLATREIEEIRNHVFSSEEPCSLDIDWNERSTAQEAGENSVLPAEENTPNGSMGNRTDRRWAQHPLATIPATV